MEGTCGRRHPWGHGWRHALGRRCSLTKAGHPHGTEVTPHQGRYSPEGLQPWVTDTGAEENT